jgi:sporulation protein YlmC with PRC-barrel domain
MEKVPVRLVKLSDSGLGPRDPDEDIRGRTVVDSEGKDIGKVDDLVVDEHERKVRFLQIATGAILPFLGFGGTKFLLPVEAVTQVQPDTVRVNESGERISGAPQYDPDLVDDVYFGLLYRYYNFRPFWGPGPEALEHPFPR